MKRLFVIALLLAAVAGCDGIELRLDSEPVDKRPAPTTPIEYSTVYPRISEYKTCYPIPGGGEECVETPLGGGIRAFRPNHTTSFGSAGCPLS